MPLSPREEHRVFAETHMRRLESQSAVIASTAATTTVRRWLCTPAPAWLVAALAVLILATPAWLLWDELRDFSLLRDDFDYIAQSRTWPMTMAHLFDPHNVHVVPIFRIWTFLLVTIARRLPNLPAVFASSSYIGLIAAMVAVAWVVVRETRRPAAGLSAMAILGISTVTHPAVTWFSASQALWAGTAILVTIALAQAWAEKGGANRLAAVGLATFLAPAIWSGGLLAGPAAVAYLYFKKSRRVTGPAVLLAGIALCSALLILALVQGQIRGAQIVWEKRVDVWPRPVQALLNTAQALVEACVCGNFGLHLTTTPRQAVALLIVLVVFYAWSRRGAGAWNSLEATGATIALGSCLLIYFFRGNQPYSSLRSLEWYHTIPQIGTILFAAGWWTAMQTQATPRPRMILAHAAAVVGLVVVFCLIQIPRAEQQLIQSVPPLILEEAGLFPSTALLAGRARYFKGEFHDRQHRALVRLDRLDRLLLNLKASPETLRGAFGRIGLPGISEKQLSCDAFSLLTPRPRNPETLAELAGRSIELVELVRPEREPALPWLDPNNPAGKKAAEGTSDSLKNHH
jgi:hypothetical protein